MELLAIRTLRFNEVRSGCVPVRNNVIGYSYYRLYYTYIIGR